MARVPLVASAFLILGALLCFSSCASLVSPSETIIERSSSIRPPWVDGDFSAEADGTETFVTSSRLGVFRLELGIKQVQAAALEKGCSLIYERLNFDVSIKTENLFGSAVKKNLEPDISNALAQLSTTFLCPELVPRQVYWENISKETENGPRTHFNIFVLLTLRTLEYHSALQMVAQSLTNSQNDKARLVGQDILKNFTN